ncbi:hypothetical protein P4233_12255, partial [Pseudomonas aeruginosa]|nr:hypothetical protein [Pseudomonas aeruginosa]
MLGEVIFGGVGAGLYGTAVRPDRGVPRRALMVGRTPQAWARNSRRRRSACWSSPCWSMPGNRRAGARRHRRLGPARGDQSRPARLQPTALR